MRYSLFEHRRDELILIDQRVKLTVKLAPSARLKRCVTFRIFEHYGVDTTRRKPFEANWPAMSSSGRASGGIVARCLNLHLRNQHAVNRTSLGDLHQSVKLILG